MSRWSKANRDKKNTINRRWRQLHPEKYIESQRKEASQLSRSYVAKKMRLRVSECPPELIELKRAHIQLIRELKKNK